LGALPERSEKEKSRKCYQHFGTVAGGNPFNVARIRNRHAQHTSKGSDLAPSRCEACGL